MKNQSIMIKGIREIVKLLFLFIVSGIETVFVYVHFEELEKLESCKVKTEE